MTKGNMERTFKINMNAARKANARDARDIWVAWMEGELNYVQANNLFRIIAGSQLFFSVTCCNK